MLIIATHLNDMAIQNFDPRPPLKVWVGSFFTGIFYNAKIWLNNASEIAQAGLVSLVRQSAMFVLFAIFLSLGFAMIPIHFLQSCFTRQRQVILEHFSNVRKMLTNPAEWKKCRFLQIFAVFWDLVFDSVNLVAAVAAGGVVLLERLASRLVPRADDEPAISDEEAFNQTTEKPLERFLWSLKSLKNLAVAVFWIRTTKPTLVALQHRARLLANSAISAIATFRGMIRAYRIALEYKNNWLTFLLRGGFWFFDVLAIVEKYVLAYFSIGVPAQENGPVPPVEPPRRVARRRVRIPDVAHNPH